MALRDGLLAEFDHEMAATRRLLACVPGDRLDWAPHPRSRSFGALASHIAAIPFWSAQILDRDAFDLDDAAEDGETVAASGQAVLSRFSEGRALARRLLDRSEAELAAQWSLRQGGQPLFSMPRAAAFRTFVLGHVVHHRGQLSVYLRLNDIPVPPIYGPSADSRRS
ncbi:MAG: DinB family protein [Vicinamibacterales bacterium]